jgi:predicted RND superfamily exporter protein
MRWLAQLLLPSKIACWGVVVAVLGIAAWFGTHAMKVGQDDDLLAFLPADNPEVKQFRALSKRFGSLDVAIVGLSVGDPFTADNIDKLGTLTRKLNEESDVAFAMSLNNVEDFEPDPKGGIKARYLLRDPPKDAEAKKKLRASVMSKNHVVGNLIAPDGQSVIIYVFLAPDTNPRASAAMVRKHVDEVYPDTPKYFGGAPFISTYIYDVTQRDMRRLIPWAVGLIILIIVASFRDVLGALLALGSTGIGIIFTYGLMGVRGINANIVLSAMPVILFAVGSAYAIHIMVRYYALRESRDPDEAMVETLAQIGPTVLAAGLTTVAGLLSFLAMDIEPMRQFGLYTGVGIFATLVLSVTFVPAVVRLLGVKARSFEASIYERLVARIVTAARSRRKEMLVLLALVLIAGGALSSRVEARMENRAFFAEGSPPDQAETFMRDHFGGSLFLQVMVEGDMNDPAVLREVQRIADHIRIQPHVSSVNHIAAVLSLAYEALDGERRVPRTVGQVRWLYKYLAGRPAIEQLLHPGRKHALIMAKIDTDEHEVVDALLSEMEVLMRTEAIRSYRIVGRPPAAELVDVAAEDVKTLPISAEDREKLDAATEHRVIVRLESELRDLGIAFETEKVAALVQGERAPPELARIEKRVLRYLTSAESLLDKRNYPHAPALAKAYAALEPNPSKEQLVATTRGVLAPEPDLSEACEEARAKRQAAAEEEDDDEDGEEEDGEAEDGEAEEEEEEPEACTAILDGYEERLVDADVLADVIGTRLSDAVRREAAAAEVRRLLDVVGAPEDADPKGLAAAFMDLDPPDGMISGGDLKMGYQVSGVPVLYRGLSTSVTQNQFKSLGMALGLVLLIMMLLFRSPVSGLLAAAPTVLTLLSIYGFMGAVGMHLDIGTSMLASIIIGAGVDYAVHLMAAWRGDSREEAAEHAARHAGPAILTNALMVAAGFFVLTLGDAKPLQNVGRLTSAAMLVAGLATFVAVPALARKSSYGKAR